MTSQNIWIGITVGVFLVGFGIGFIVFSNQSMNAFHNQNMFNQMMGQNPQTMTWMMKDPQIKQQMFQQMMQDPEQMMGWMANDSKHIEQMSKIMKDNHVFMSKMMSTMMNDPDLRLQMVGHMSENPEALKQMMSVWSSGNVTNTMSNMMDSGMMGQQMHGQEKQTDTTSTSYVKIVDGIQIVTVHAKDFKFIPSEIHIKAGKTKFVMVNDGVAEHELVVYDASKKEIVDKAELAEDEKTIQANILFEIDHTAGGQSAESDVIDLNVGSYVIGCHIPGHYEAGMNGTIDIAE